MLQKTDVLVERIINAYLTNRNQPEKVFRREGIKMGHHHGCDYSFGYKGGSERAEKNW